MTRLCIYSRKSKATLKGDSIGNQIDMCRSYVAMKYPELPPEAVDVYEDDGFSGKNTNRPAFARMLEALRRGEYACLIVYRLDRISRSVGDFADILKILERTGTKFISINEQFDTSSAIGRAMMSIASVFAQMERETISERVTDNMLLLSHTGRWLGGRTPTGFVARRVKADPAAGIAKSYSVLEADPAAFSQVRQAVDAYLQLGSLRAAVQRLHQQDIRPAGRSLTDVSLRGILTNPVYCAADAQAYDYFYDLGCVLPSDRADFDGHCGCMPYNRHGVRGGSGYLRGAADWVIAVGSHPPLMTGSEFRTVQERLQQAAKQHPRRQHARNDYALLTGLLVCGRCGSRMYTQPQNSGRGYGFTYICERRKQLGKHGCDCPSVSGVRLDDAIRAAVSACRSPDSAFFRRLEALRAESAPAPDDLSADRAELARQERRLHTLIDRLADPELTAGAVGYVRAEINRQEEAVAALKQRLAAADEALRSREQAEAGYAAVCELLDDFTAMYDRMTIPQQRDMLRRAIDRIVWDGEHADIFPRGS